jgi:hypothetical protein
LAAPADSTMSMPTRPDATCTFRALGPLLESPRIRFRFWWSPSKVSSTTNGTTS